MGSRRDEESDWRGDAFYEAWRRGVPEGRMDYDRMSDAFYNGESPDGYVGGVCRRMHAEREERERLAAQEAYEIEQAQREYFEQAEDETKGGG